MILSVILIPVVFYVGHYYYIHSSTKRVFDTQKQLRPIEYIGTVVRQRKQISYGIIDSSVKEVRHKGKKLPFVKYSNMRIWYNISEPTNQVSKTRP